MGNTTCPYCREDIREGAKICKHCRSTLRISREEIIIAEILNRIEKSSFSPSIPGPISDCTADCYFTYRNGRKGLHDCLRECNINSGIAAMAEKLHRELVVTFMDIVWGGGNIDPLDPIIFEKTVRERFSRPHQQG